MLKMYTWAVYLILIFTPTFTWSASVKKECLPPIPGEPIDWGRMPSPWYLTRSAHNPEVDAVACLVIRDFHVADDGFRADAENYRLSNGTLVQGVLQLHQIRQASGGYMMDSAAEDQWKQELAENPELQKEFDEVVDGNHEFIYTDYENYIIAIMCSNTGEPLLGIQHRSAHPTEESRKKGARKLRELGRGWHEVPLHSTGCADIESFPGYEKFADQFVVGDH